MVLLDKDGYCNNPEITKTALGEFHLLPHESFYDFVNSLELNSGTLGGLYARVNNDTDRTNTALIFYHLTRFLDYGKVIYKIRRHMTERIKNITLDVPCKLLVAPRKEFVISIPFGTVTTDLGSLVNIYVSYEPFNREHYKDDNGTFRTDGGVGGLLKEDHVITRNIRALGVFYKKESDVNGDTAYYQLPLAEDMNAQELFDTMLGRVEYANKESIRTVFNFVLNFCAYLSTKDPDVQKVLGITYKTTSSNPKKQRVSELNKRLYGYDYQDVGRIYDTRYIGKSHGAGQQILKKFFVRSHIRAQWYGPRDAQYQKLILIEEYVKGADFEDIAPKTTVVGFINSQSRCSTIP